MHRQCLFGGLRIGLYEPVKALYMGKDFKGDPPLYMKIAAGLTTGGIAIAIASPTDLVKVSHFQFLTEHPFYINYCRNTSLVCCRTVNIFSLPGRQISDQLHRYGLRKRGRVSCCLLIPWLS